MKKNKIIIISIILIIIFMNPKTINNIKSKINNSKVNIEEKKEISYGYSSDTSFIEYRDGFLMYDGKSLKYIDNEAQREFDLNIRVENYSIDTNNSNIYLLDKIKKEVYIIDKKGSLTNKVNIKENALMIKALYNDDFLIHYTTDVDVEGVKLYSYKGKEIQDISIPQITINLVDVDKDASNFVISGISIKDDRLYNNIFYYNKKGELIFSYNIENKVFVKTMFLDDKLVLVDPKYIEIKDLDNEKVKKINLDEEIQYIDIINDEIVVIDSNKNVIYIDKVGKEKNKEYDIKNIKGIKNIENQNIVYTDRSIYLPKNKEKKDFTKDILDVFTIHDNRVIVVFRGYVKFLSID
ncbi:DUF5711 family protein [Tepidibacter aestuarii]|uniref:DUF5711 family protein n=1 Tax=Tepidibacter aestuarii TaxID=2925782 RepID=UPI0020BFE42C|nr:DUF5711 family protein [Tepidibacter aestuarii]CAH2215352.1 conserved exported protein of unknown function [Tepidibacter aestuarii]